MSAICLCRLGSNYAILAHAYFVSALDQTSGHENLESAPARFLEALALLIEYLMLLPSASQAATYVVHPNGIAEGLPVQDQVFEPTPISYDPQNVDGPESGALPPPWYFFQPSGPSVSLVNDISCPN
jgi:hypothetical protein